MIQIHSLKINQYSLLESSELGSVITLDRVPSREGDRWAIRSLYGDCLNKSGEWEDEPSPSNRDNEFFARCRWITAEEALKFFNDRYDQVTK